jgi:hypothetical protein
MAPLRSFPLTVSSPCFCPASLPSDRVISTLSLVHWHTQHPSHPPPPPQQMIEHASFANATPHWTSRGCHSCHLISSKCSTSSPWCSTPCVAPPFTAYYDWTRSPGSNDLHNKGADDASGLCRQRSRILQLLRQGTLTTSTSAPAGTSMRTWSPEFHSPAGFTADDARSHRV